jgi:hypothetical protein
MKNIARKRSRNKQKTIQTKRKQVLNCKDIKNIKNAVSSFFDERSLCDLANSVGFIKKNKKMTPFIFLSTMSLSLFNKPDTALCGLSSTIRSCFNVDITAQALSKHVNSCAAVKFLKNALHEIISKQLAFSFENKYTKMFSQFSGVYLEDSTNIRLNKKLEETFTGYGGDASKSIVKINWVLEILRFKTRSATLHSGNCPDQTLGQRDLALIKKGMLLIRDLGYFSLKALKNIEKKNAFYLSRLPMNINVYLNEGDTKPIDLPKLLKEETYRTGVKRLRKTVFLGPERHKVNLIAELVPPKVINQRRKRFKGHRRKDPSEFFMEWNQFSIFITNIPEEKFSEKLIITLYKVRWQIELLFKTLKSTFRINILKGYKKNRILCLIYGRIISFILGAIILSFARSECGEQEVSIFKFFKWLQTDCRLMFAIIENCIDELIMEIPHNFKNICMNKRKGKKSTMISLEEILEELREAA